MAVTTLSQGIRVVALFLPFALLISIWFPVLRYYQVNVPDLDDRIVERLRSEPDSEKMAVLGSQFLGPRVPSIEVGRSRKESRTELTSHQSENTKRTKQIDYFYQEKFGTGTPKELLTASGLFDVENALLEYEANGDEALFSKISQSIFRFTDFEANIFLPRGYIWDDHALANRMFVLTRFWKHYRNHSIFQLDNGKKVVAHVIRSSAFLAASQRFTYKTNHGMMQSIALLHIAAAFPLIPEREELIGLALHRLRQQMAYYVTQNGWVLEHSAEYQVFGQSLLDTLAVDLESLAIEMPNAWTSKIASLRGILLRLLRPDGSLPNYGDTNLGSNAMALESNNCGQSELGFWPVEGYLVAWQSESIDSVNRCSQAVASWSNFIGKSHKHADEMSVHHWIDGVDWLLAAGYWAYGHSNRRDAVSWRGSNAPHILGEDTSLDRETVVKNYCRGDGFWLIDMERTVANSDTKVRRQLAGIGASGGIALDMTSGPSSDVIESVWRFAVGATLARESANEFLVAARDERRHLMFTVQGDEADTQVSESFDQSPAVTDDTFLELVASHDQFFKVPSLAVTSGPGRPVLIAWSGHVNSSGDKSHVPNLISYWRDPEHWAIKSKDGASSIERAADGLTLREYDSVTKLACEIGTSQQDINEINRLTNLYQRTAQEFGVFKPWLSYRLNLSYMIIGLAVFQIISLVFLGRYRPRSVRPVEITMIAIWAAIWLVINGWYLSANQVA